MNYASAFWAGISGGVVMSCLMIIDINFAFMIGTLFGLSPSQATWLFGYILYLIIAGLIGIIYAIAFETITQQADWKIGAMFGLIHLAVSGLFLGILPIIHPAIPEVIPAPGPFAINLGVVNVASFVVFHLIYGAIVGALYQPVQYTSYVE
ncbi:MAG: hypothetical protein AB1489_07065 [Acidobacteriota bacterium]